MYGADRCSSDVTSGTLAEIRKRMSIVELGKRNGSWIGMIDDSGGADP